MEWYVVERAADDDGRPLAARSLVAEAADREVVAALCTSHRSLFELRAVRAGQVELRDLIGGATFAVDEVGEVGALVGVNVGDVAELRLVGVDGHVRFGRTFVFHPALARDAIVARIRAGLVAGRRRGELVDEVARLRLDYERASDPRMGVTRSRMTAARRVYDRGLGGRER
ncbi:MAG: hypothetical protein R2939_23040 [Kofleriaceae bacterium]